LTGSTEKKFRLEKLDISEAKKYFF
jgi:hypothetical protein